MKYSVIFFIGMLFLQSCEPPVDCTDPKCANSPIEAKLKANLSDTNSIFRVGDTLKMRLRVPDTLITNQSTYYLESIRNTSIDLDYYRVDTIITQTNARIIDDSFQIKKGKYAPQSTVVEFDYASKEIELHFLLNKKGKFYVQIGEQSRRMECTLKNGNKLLVMINVGFNVSDSHHSLFLSWISDTNYRTQMRNHLSDLTTKGVGFYAFKVE